MHATRQATICALNQMLDLKDLNTGVHSTRLAEWAVRIGQELGLQESGLEDIEVAALLHDAGKVGVPDAILKKPGALDPAEWRVMRMHPEFSWAVLRLVPGLERASLYALHHHEKYNGSGYPAGLKGEEIPIGSRIVSVIDAFDAMVANRPYKEGLPIEEALRRLVRTAGATSIPWSSSTSSGSPAPRCRRCSRPPASASPRSSKANPLPGISGAAPFFRPFTFGISLTRILGRPYRDPPLRLNTSPSARPCSGRRSRRLPMCRTIRHEESSHARTERNPPMTKFLRRIGALARPWGRTALAGAALLALTFTQPVANAIQSGNADAVLGEARNYDRRIEHNRGFRVARRRAGSRVAGASRWPGSPTSTSRATTSSGPCAASPARSRT